MISYIKGDLFTHSPASKTAVTILAHACNCRGSWGAGVAAIFKKKYPMSYKQYVGYCRDHSDNPSSLLGKTLLISSPNRGHENSTYIACLFTSDLTGRDKLQPSEIVKNTGAAMNHLRQQLNQLKDVEFETNNDLKIVNMPKINAGLFGVPWEDTERVLNEYQDIDINVYVID
jgi:ADP-ribose 1''-phosphate phosphatase